MIPRYYRVFNREHLYAYLFTIMSDVHLSF